MNIFDFYGDIIPTIAELYIGNQLVSKEELTMPDELIKQNFLAMVRQIANQKQPMKIKFIRYIDIYDKFENKIKKHESILEFQNWKDD